jgi:hypothetical protein
LEGGGPGRLRYTQSALCSFGAVSLALEIISNFTN